MQTATDAIGTLRGSVSGQVLEPADTGYEQARQIHNGLVTKRPGLIVRCQNTADVVDAVNHARTQGMEISVRGGGHNVAGLAVTDSGLMIDLAPMRGIHVDPVNRTVRAQPGLTWREYNRATALHGLATTGGVISTTGIAGLTLGGGLGWLMAKYGSAVDNLLSAEIVLASGEVVTASEDTDSDLFWAIRGGGGNFGVATSFEFRAHPLQTVLGGIIAHPLEAGRDVFPFYREFTSNLENDDLTLFCGLVHAPDGSGMKLCGMPICHAGDDHDQATEDVRPLREFGPPAMDMTDRMPYWVQNTLLDDGFPRGTFNYWRSGYFTDLSDGAAEILIDAFANSPTAMCGIVVEHFHGAVTRIDPTATAFPHRSPGYNVVLASQWTDPAQTEEGVAWARETYEALRPHMADRFYVNYMAADEADRVRKAYGPNYDRLLELKRRYDPDNLFRLNLNIDPAG